MTEIASALLLLRPSWRRSAAAGSCGNGCAREDPSRGAWWEPWCLSATGSSQPSKTARTSAASMRPTAAIFIVLSLLWGRVFDGFKADRWDLLGLSAEGLPDRCVGGLRAPAERFSSSFGGGRWKAASLRL